MNQTILFTPVGGTDPISLSNCRDGSMLHICRVYKPTRVVMYMSQEVLENQKKDDRYRYCLQKLAELQNRSFEWEIIERPELKNVQDFDYFYQDFRGIIESVFKEMDESDMLLLNVSSGTPAMKSGLLVLQTLGEFPCKLIQVVTPARKMNEHIHKDYDVEVLWELNEDNEEHFENRCIETKCPTLSMIKNEEIIKKHIWVYDYQAAISVARTMPVQHTAGYMDLLEMAASRLLLDFKNVDRILAKTKVDCLPVKENRARKYFEYALGLDIKLRRAEYADFIRGITPLIVDLFEMILKNNCHIDIDDYCAQGNGMRKWDSSRIQGTEIERVFNEEFQSGFKCGPVYSIHLKYLIQHFSSDSRLISLVEDLRNVETSIRNIAAHEIVSITEDTIQKRTGFTGKQIMKKIRAIFVYAGFHITEDSWNSYDRMNQMIMQAMN